MVVVTVLMTFFYIAQKTLGLGSAAILSVAQRKKNLLMPSVQHESTHYGHFLRDNGMVLLQGTTSKRNSLSRGVVRSLLLKDLSSKSTLIKID